MDQSWFTPEVHTVFETLGNRIINETFDLPESNRPLVWTKESRTEFINSKYIELNGLKSHPDLNDKAFEEEIENSICNNNIRNFQMWFWAFAKNKKSVNEACGKMIEKLNGNLDKLSQITSAMKWFLEVNGIKLQLE